MKPQVSIDDSSDICLNCYLKFHFRGIFVAYFWARLDKGGFFYSTCNICRPIIMMTVNNHVLNVAHGDIYKYVSQFSDSEAT
jgi:hypothetical protein